VTWKGRLLLASVAIGATGLLPAACGERPGPPAREVPERQAALSIAAASDLRYALDDLVEAFGSQHPGAGVAVTYGSSGSFYAQLVNGAPFDVYLSADIAYARQLADRGLALSDTLFTYAEGRIVLWISRSSSLDIDALGLGALADRAVTRVAIANPAHAPYGRAAEAALESAGLLEAVKPKLVLGENVSQALQFVQSGSADAGIVALSLAVAPPVAPSGRYWLVPGDTHPRIQQGGVIMRAAARQDLAQAFRTFMVEREARAVLSRYGFVVPEP
jgi:molybdate transport system substrate-binding protein